MADTPPYLSFNTQLRYGNWTGPGYSAGRTSPPFVAYTQADLNYPGYDDFDTSLSKPHDLAYEQAQVTFDSQWDAATASQRVTLLVNYFQTIENADLNFIAGIPFHSAVNDWGNTLRFLAAPTFAATAAVDAETIHLLTTDPNYAANLTGLSRQQVENRIDTTVDTALNAALYWFAQLGEIAAAVAAATTSLKDLVDALNHGDDYADQAAALIGSGGSSSGLLNTVLQQLQGRSGAIHDIARASSSTGGTEGNGNSLHPSISGDGHFVAFYSYASNLIAGDTNGVSDIFVYDRQAGTTTRVSVGVGGAEANHPSFDPSITSDGRYVAFESGATNLVQSDLAGWDEIFVYDRSTGTTVRASMGLPAQGQSEPNFPSMHPSIALDASGTNYAVAYASDASNLVAGDSNNGARDIFLYKSSTHAITAITNGNGTSDNPSISTGGTIAFESYASNLVSGDTNGFEDVFLYTGSGIVRIAPNGVQPNGNSAHPSISADGKFIAFQSLASNLVAGDTNTVWDIFVYDVVNHTIERISVGVNGAESNNDSFAPSISGDGRFVTYESRANNLVPGQTSHAEQTFVYDRQLHTTKLISVSAAGEQGNQDSVDPVISADGSTVAFDSGATNLYRQDGALDDIFVTDALNFFNKGGPQNDVIGSALGNDVLDGGGGINTVSYATIAAAVTVSLAVTVAQNTGGAGTDTLSNFANITGGSGGDHLTGDAAANSLDGGNGDDVLNGGAGADILTGGAGNDKFLFDAAALTDATAATHVFDEVKDYTAGDQLDLSALLATAYNHGSGQAVGALVRAIEDGSGSFAKLQIDPDGTANGANWITIARLDGVPAGFNLNVILDATLPAGTSVGVSPPAGAVAINDVSVSEGNSGTKVMTFTVTRSGGTGAFDVGFATADGSATVADGDYVATSGTLHFGVGVNTQTISVTINGDLKIEPSQTFTVNLSGATNDAIISDGQGVGTITNDDGAPAPRDFNADGTSDILWHNDNGATSIWDSGQLGGAHIIAAAGVVPSSYHIVGIGDFDGNGKSDLLWQNDNGLVSIWDNAQLGGAHVIANAGVVPSGWHVAGVGDFDGNGKSDILWQNDNGMVSIWDNGQIAGAHIVANAGVVPGSFHIAGIGDFDGNGKSDILWRNDNGQISIWDNGQIAGAHIVANAGVVPSSYRIAGTGDFDGNGKSDILWQNDNGLVSIWDNGQLGGAHVVANAGVVPSSFHIAGTGDFDGNGKSDILWRNDSGATSIWDNGQLAGAHVIANAGVVDGTWHIV